MFLSTSCIGTKKGGMKCVSVLSAMTEPSSVALARLRADGVIMKSAGAGGNVVS